jgi:hypothetical protein
MRKFWLRAVVHSALLVCSSCGLQNVYASPVSPKASAQPGIHYERRVLNYLWPVLKSADKAGRIYYRATCPPDEHYPLAFPQLDVEPPLGSETGLVAVRSIFRKERDLTVTENETGIIRVRIGRVPRSILQTRITRLHLAPETQYNVLLAINAIERSPEVQSAMSKLNISVPERPYNFLVVQPSEGLPHLPTEILNVTMDQALDMVARTWKGIVLYGACRRPGTFEVSFEGGVYFRDSKF